MPDWAERQREIERTAERQLFFVGGAPRSGTTWLQQILDSHPAISCRGEALFDTALAAPLARAMQERTTALAAKNSSVFRDSGGYPLPEPEDTDFLFRTAILLELHRQSRGKACLAVGEKTPENVFFFPRLKTLFPDAKLIVIARDPRDVLTSAWHFFQKNAAGGDADEAKTAFIRSALPSLGQGANATIALAQAHPSDCAIVTYEALKSDPAPVLARLLHFLGVAADDGVVADCIRRTSFAAMTAGRGVPAEPGSFMRKGVVGDWTSTLTPAMNQMVLRELGWMFPHFGWTP